MVINFRFLKCKGGGGGGGGAAVVKALNVVENGTYKPGPGLDGYAPVSVNVQPPLQEKTQDITKNGTTEITTTDGNYGMSKVVLNVDVKPEHIPVDEYWGLKFGKSSEIPSFFDFSNITDGTEMFHSCHSIRVFPKIGTSKLRGAAQMFYECYEIAEWPFDGSSFPGYDGYGSFDYLFYGCLNTNMAIPDLDLSNFKRVYGWFSGCDKLEKAPNITFKIVKDVENLFSGCGKIKTIPAYNLSTVENVDEMLSNCKGLESIPELDFGNVKNMYNFLGWYEFPNLTDLGGFKNLKVEWIQGLTLCPNLTKQSLMNVINDLYDFRGNGDASTIRTLKLHANGMALLSPEDQAIATNKGWRLEA